MTREVATFGAGCFWGVEAAFSKVKGVVETAVGFMGGSVKSPRYNEVCSGRTGHAEVVQLVFNPSTVSYTQLLEVFLSIHDPTQLNRQGADVGTQYRSVIFYHSRKQEAAAENALRKLRHDKKYSGRTIATAIEPASDFYRAEKYHQRYLEKRGLPGCVTIFKYGFLIPY